MLGNPQNTTPASCDSGSGVRSGGDSPLTPTKLMLSDSLHCEASVATTKELSPHAHTSTPPSSPKNNAATTEGDNLSIQDRFGNVNFTRSLLGLKHLEGKENKYDLSTVLFGCMFAYVILGIWIWTVTFLILVMNQKNCSDEYADLLQQGASASIVPCLEIYTGKMACAHSITFGLISAVVIHETGSAEDTAKQRLSSMIKPVLKQGLASNANAIQRALCSAIVLLPSVYVVFWTIFGLICFVISVSSPDGSSGPLFYTGQTWLGITIKASYSFFGVKQDSPVSNDSGHPYHFTQDVDEEMGLLQHNHN